MRWFLLVAVAGCAPDLRKDYPFDGITDLDAGPRFSFVAADDAGVREARVDATNRSQRVFVDLDTDSELSFDEVAMNTWDVAFRRDNIQSNSGPRTNGTGTVGVALLTGVAFEQVTRAPAEGYRSDGPLDADTVFNAGEGAWYRYDIGVHRLFTNDALVYVIKSSSGRYLKLKMLSYYDEAGSPARLSFRYQTIEGP
jgi:hypothetical protein